MTERDTWNEIGQNDPYCGTGGPTKAVPHLGKFAAPDTALLSEVEGEPGILDVGCGYGRNSIPLFNKSHNIVACDVSRTMSRTVLDAGVPFVMCDIHHLPFREMAVDCLICSHVIQHMQRDDVERVLWELRRVAKKALIVMPNPLGVACFFGARPLVHALVMFNKRPGRGFFENIPTVRGYIVNYYLPWVFARLAKRWFDRVKVTRGTGQGRLPAFLANSLLYICS